MALRVVIIGFSASSKTPGMAPTSDLLDENEEDRATPYRRCILTLRREAEQRP